MSEKFIVVKLIINKRSQKMRPFQHRAGIISSVGLTPIFNEVTEIYKDKAKRPSDWAEIHEKLAEQAVSEGLVNDRNVIVEIICYISDLEKSVGLQFALHFDQLGIGSESSLWHATFSLINEKNHEYIHAAMIYQRGFENTVKPIEFLRIQHEKFCKRVSDDLTSHTHGLTLGEYNGKNYEYDGKNVQCFDESGSLIEPEIDFFSLVGFAPQRGASSFAVSTMNSLNHSTTDRSQVMNFPPAPLQSAFKRPLNTGVTEVLADDINDIDTSPFISSPRPLLRRDGANDRSGTGILKKKLNFGEIDDDDDDDNFNNSSMFKRRTGGGILKRKFDDDDDNVNRSSMFKSRFNDDNNEDAKPAGILKPRQGASKNKVPLNRSSFFNDDDDEEDAKPAGILKRRVADDDDENEDIPKPRSSIMKRNKVPLNRSSFFNDDNDDDEASKPAGILKRRDADDDDEGMPKPRSGIMKRNKTPLNKSSFFNNDDEEENDKPVSILKRRDNDDEEDEGIPKPRSGIMKRNKVPLNRNSFFNNDDDEENKDEGMLKPRPSIMKKNKTPLNNSNFFNNDSEDPDSFSRPILKNKKTPEKVAFRHASDATDSIMGMPTPTFDPILPESSDSFEPQPILMNGSRPKLNLTETTEDMFQKEDDQPHRVSIVSNQSMERVKPRPGTPVGNLTRREPRFIEERKLGDVASLCKLDGTNEYYVMKPLPSSDVFNFRPRNEEYFVLPLAKFPNSFVTEYHELGTLEDSLPFVHEKPIPDQRLCYFIMLQFVRILQGLEGAGMYHGNLSLLSFYLRSQSEPLNPFDDGSLWRQTGFSLGEIDSLREGSSSNDREEIAKMFWLLATNKDWNDSVPCQRRYDSKLWKLTFETLLGNGDLNKLELEIVNYLKKEAAGTNSIVSRLLVHSMNNKV